MSLILRQRLRLRQPEFEIVWQLTLRFNSGSGVEPETCRVQPKYERVWSDPNTEIQTNTQYKAYSASCISDNTRFNLAMFMYVCIIVAALRKQM